MGRSFVRQDAQIRESITYDDSVVPSLANYETNATDIEYDLNALRSRAQDYLNRDGASMPSGDWYGIIAAPSTFESGSQRGLNTLGQDLHDLERKRILDRVSNIALDVAPSNGVQHHILALADLPGNTTMAVGAVTTLGTVVAVATSFDTASASDDVTGPNALRPKNLLVLWHSDAGSDVGDPLEDGNGNQIYGLLQSENAADGHTATGTTSDRLQISFVTINTNGDDLELITAGEMDGIVFDYAHVQRYALADLPEDAFLGGDFVDSGVANATRELGYTNQGTTPVDLTTSAFLDLKTASATWKIRDLASADILAITEGSGGSTTTVLIAPDLFNNLSVENLFEHGVTLDNGSNPLTVGLTAGLISSTNIDLTLRSAANELLLDDINRTTASGWAQAGLKLSETPAEWEAWETAFSGEDSIMSAVVKAFNAGGVGSKVQTTLTSSPAAAVDIGGPGGTVTNCTVNLPAYDNVTFITDVDVMYNGEMLRNAANVGGGEDVYPGTDPSLGDLRFQFGLHGTGSKPDQLTIVVRGQ